MFSRSFKGVGLHYTAFRDAIREDSRQTTPSRGVTPRKKFAVEANVESRVKMFNKRDKDCISSRQQKYIDGLIGFKIKPYLAQNLSLKTRSKTQS